MKINKPFVFLKIKYKLLDDGTIVKKLHRDSITRERRKIKRYSNSNLSYKVIENSYKSWRGNAIHFHSHKSIKDLDELYNRTFFKWFL